VKVLVLRESEIRSLAGPREALREVREAFARLARGEATLPGVIGLDIPEAQGEVHVKGAYLKGAPYFSIKEAAGFYGNSARGLPMSSGLILVFDAQTGFLSAILFDNAYLTELRTGAAGALAADLLARKQVRRVGLIGTGATAVQCVPYLSRDCRELYVFQRTPSSVDVRDNHPIDPRWFAAVATPGWQQRWLDNFTANQAGGTADEDLVQDGWTDIARRIRARIAALPRSGYAEWAAMPAAYYSVRMRNTSSRDRAVFTASASPGRLNVASSWKYPRLSPAMLPT
jgi:hypothetical protein